MFMLSAVKRCKSAFRLLILQFIVTIFLIPVCSIAENLPPIINGRLPGFFISPHFDEQITTYTFAPEVKVHINAPAPNSLDLQKPTQLIFYALPNGNTTAQTIGKKLQKGDDWHFDIQHIGAQTRRLREVITEENIVIAYLETFDKSWPSWCRKNPDSRKLIQQLIQSVKSKLPLSNLTLCLSGHSGGGSFIFTYLNSISQIPDEITRISFLDSNYGYSDAEQHGDKLCEWLKRSSNHHLSIIAYDDRNVRFQGKLIVGPEGGTYRKTFKMIERLQKDFELVQSREKDYLKFRGLNGRIDIIILENPTNAILHTALVGDKNGFIRSMTAGTKYENKVALFGGGIAYAKWIQPY